jgi:hypothetical protein
MGTCRTLIAVGAVLVGSATADGQTRVTESDLMRARQSMVAVEDALERAIANGAQMVIAQFRTAAPERWRLSSEPRADGARIPDQGATFFVQVPDLEPPMMWTLRRIQQEPPRPDPLAVQRLQQMRTIASTMQGAERLQWERAITELEMQITLGNARARDVGRGSVSAASLTPSVPQQGSQRPVEPQVSDDPDEEYTRQVKGALIDTMLKQTQVLSLQPAEWLTVVARTSASPDPLMPADTTNLSTWVMRVKGSTLEAFRARKITEQEALKLVEVLEQ